jgi:SEC-C motif-containing protein
LTKKTLCPCGSSRPYKECCRPFHRGEREAPDPESLVRARFSAFATGEVPYIVKTLHGDHADRARPEAELVRDLRETCRVLRYMRLDILERGPGRVRFRVKVFHKGQDVSFEELSEFAHDGVGWRYLRGDTGAAKQ